MSVPLEIPSDEYRRLAELTSDLAATYLDTIAERPTFPQTTGPASAAAFEEPLPEEGIGAAAFEALNTVADLSRTPNGRWMSHVPNSAVPVGALADFFASVINQNVTAWRASPGGVSVERVVVGWLTEALGLDGFSGSFTSGGSSANLMGLAMAREAKAPANDTGVTGGVVYTSSEAHMAVAKAVAVLGLGRDNLRVIPVDEDFRMEVDVLEQTIAKDLAAGLKPIAVVASAGTTNTGSIDQLTEVARVARAHDLWLHVDAAYGGFAVLAVPEKFTGLDLADSIALDAHKWMYQAYDCSLVLHRDRDAARRTFTFTGDYAKVLFDDPVESFAYFEESVELSRRFRALKLWLALRYHGMRAFREAIRDDLRHAQQLASLVDAEPSLERLAPVPLSAVCFRWNDGSTDAATLDKLNEEIVVKVIRRGRVYISNATIRGAFAMRACIVNHRTTDDDIALVMDEVLAAAADVTGRAEISGSRPGAS